MIPVSGKSKKGAHDAQRWKSVLILSEEAKQERTYLLKSGHTAMHTLFCKECLDEGIVYALSGKTPTNMWATHHGGRRPGGDNSESKCKQRAAHFGNN